MTPRRSIGSLIVENQALKADIAALKADLAAAREERDQAEHYRAEWERVCGDWQQSSFENSQRAAAAEAEIDRLTKALALAILATT